MPTKSARNSFMTMLAVVLAVGMGRLQEVRAGRGGARRGAGAPPSP